METGPGAGPDHLTHLARLIRSPETHHIFHALRVIEAAFAEAPRLGESARPGQDRLRIGQEAELAFPTSSIAAFRPPPAIAAALARAGDGAPENGMPENGMPENGPPGIGPGDVAPPQTAGPAPGADARADPADAAGVWRLTNRFFGFFGPQGPLPLHLTEYARDRQRNHRDPTFVAFADMLTHRLASLFYRAWTTAHPAPSFDRSRADTHHAGRARADARHAGRARDPFADKVAAIAGVLGPGFANRDALPDMARRHFAGFYGQGARHGDGLVAILSAFVRAPVTLQQFVGTWLALEPGDRWRLGARAGLGRDTSIGTRVWSRSAKFRLRIGPLSLADYRRLLPGSASLGRIDAVVRSYAGDALDYEVNPVLRAAEVPKARIGADTALGHTSWIGDRGPGAGDAGELCLQPQRLRPGPAADTGADTGAVPWAVPGGPSTTPPRPADSGRTAAAMEGTDR